MGSHPDSEPVRPPTLRIPVPSERWVVIVISDGDHFAVTEVPQSVLTNGQGSKYAASIFRDLNEQLRRAK